MVFDALVPGNYTLTARVGECKDTSLGCWHDEKCEDGCNSYRHKFIVPFGQGQLEWDFPMPSPKPKPAVAEVAPRPSQAPKTVTTPSPKGPASRVVLASEFASWLGSHPQWQQKSAIPEGRAKAGYLKGWDGATPPAGTANKAVVNVSWYSANAYCRDHGGLADIADKPHRWPEGDTTPYIELRSNEGKPAWRSNDGRDSTQIGLADIMALAGFRCKR
ncbi:MAG: hypothetical protein GWP91_26090 [Rhodobacterales bacterium]|nr:hypothetical protein [Rhodobacterales bacterium]